jgi:hypothetical protein
VPRNFEELAVEDGCHGSGSAAWKEVREAVPVEAIEVENLDESVQGYFLGKTENSKVALGSIDPVPGH